MYPYICTGAAVVAMSAAAEKEGEEETVAVAAQSHFIERISFSFIVTTIVRYNREIYRNRGDL